MRLRWYAARLRRMDLREVAWRSRNAILHGTWRWRSGERWPLPPATPQFAGRGLPPVLGEPAAMAALNGAAEAVLKGEWLEFGAPAMVAGDDPDWFHDPATGRRAPSQTYCFDIPYRDEDRVGNVKFVWEAARLHHVTLLAAAYRLTGRTVFADRAVGHTRSWCRANPPLRGIHWVSGIELGLRLIAWVWTRRLLDGHAGIAHVFERSEMFQRQLHAHQTWIATFRSRGSSANNHLIAELAGLLVSASAFPMFRESAGWVALARDGLERQIALQTFPDGFNRELASDYHVFVLELLLVAGIEADAAGAPMSEAYWTRLRDMADVLAATVDVGLQTASQGDSDDGRALLLEPTPASAQAIVLDICGRLLGPAPWWPRLPASGVTVSMLASLGRSRHGLSAPRAVRRPNWFRNAGIAIIRDHPDCAEEIWCRFDVGPHGFLSTSAHAHADALAFELRVAGQPIFVDPGTYCYHGAPAWRRYFRSTIAHGTLELGGRDQAEQGGPFLWLTQPVTQVGGISGLDAGDIACAEGCHDGYRRLACASVHHRRITLHRRARTLEVLDWVEGKASVNVRLAFTLHPKLACDLRETEASLAWSDGNRRREATLRLPPGLDWTAHHGQTQPILGWYSAHFGSKVPTTLLLGQGRAIPGTPLQTQVAFGDAPA